MARLNCAPQAANVELSPSMVSRSYDSSAETDAAVQQLNAETGTAIPRPAQTSAVLGAHLLNAARAEHHRSSPVSTETIRKPRPGRLKSVGVPAVRLPRRNLARRGDQYDIDSGLAKSHSAFNEEANCEETTAVHNSALDIAPNSRLTKRRARRRQLPDTGAKKVRRSRPEVQIPESENSKRMSTLRRRVALDVCPATTSQPSTADRHKRSLIQSTTNVTLPPEEIATKERQRRETTDVLMSPQSEQPDDQFSHDQDLNDGGPESNISERGEQENDAEHHNISQQALQVGANRTFHIVFEFAHLGERPGGCQTNAGMNIRRLCTRSCALLQREVLQFERLSRVTDDICRALRSVDTIVEERDQGAFKGDAYAYIFRAIIFYLEAVYESFDGKDEAQVESQRTTRLLLRLVHEILRFKNTITGWRVAIPQRYKGDRFILEVHTQIITPLREMETKLRAQLRQCESTKHQQQRLAELHSISKEKEDEEGRKSKTIAASGWRWKRWQDLHISRMECEPSPSRRTRLRITRLEGLRDTDANGYEFERVPVFKPRSNMGLSRALGLFGDREWNDEAEFALLDGLQHLSGPDVFESIFKKYCRPGGHLRDYTVIDIVAKTAWIYSRWLKLKEERGWEMPDWIKNLPILP